MTDSDCFLKFKTFLNMFISDSIIRKVLQFTAMLMVLLMTAATAGAETITLTSETGQVTLQDGDVLTGTGGVSTHAVIADGATVTLSGVDIYTIVDVYETQYPWPTITCQGDAVIILEKGTSNRVKSNNAYYPGIYIPVGHTLTIRGKGSLEVSNSGTAAGIGAGWYLDCGNIRIEDGNITATGAGKVRYDNEESLWSDGAAAIGSCKDGNCGDITITGGNVDATGAMYAAAIGSGNQGTCGNITISSGMTYVKAYVLGNSSNSIGPGNDGSCGTVTIGGVTGYATTSPYIFAPTDNPYTVIFNANDGTGTTTTQSLYSNTPQALTANPFTRTNYAFLGWNTKPNGCGDDYVNGETVNNLGDVTLYAQWHAPYLISFESNGGTGAMADQIIIWNSTQQLTANTFTRTGFTFTGWNTKADGSGTSYTDEQSITNLEDMTLFAQWQTAIYSITYNLNGGSNSSSNPATYTIESDAITLAEPTRFGFIFAGWTFEGQDEPTKNVTIANGSHGDKTYTAHWTLDPIVTITAETGNAALFDGHILTGTGGTNTHVTIADGATVTLSGVTITDITNDGSHMWSGITCLGDATIILADGTVNNLKGGYGSYPGISVPENKTLTIQGSGTLYLSSNGHGPGIGPDGYGGGEGNITIEGGTIIATGSNGDAGIGGTYSSGNITISDGVTSVTATAGTGAPYSIGTGHGTVTIGGVVTGDIPQSSFTYNPSDTTPYTVTFNANGGEGTMDGQEFVPNTLQALNTCTFTREGYEFTGWNTKADGTGTNFSDGQNVINLGNVTLFAQWWSLGITKTITSSSTDVELVDCDVVTGTGGRNTHVTIADGATVTFSGVNITSINNSSSNRWAGISCLGDATIILSGENAVKGGYHSAGIFVPAGKTLTIRGDGSLTATGQSYAAGIGSGEEENCGNIVIEGGTIAATGEVSAAGIGCGNYASCGDITITGGTITATAGTSASAIGCGVSKIININSFNPSSCGDITIANSVTCVTATSSKNVNIIGTSDQFSTCGTITIDPSLMDVLSNENKTRTLYPGITFAKEGYSTYFDSEHDAKLPSGMKARIVTAKSDGNTLTYQTVADGDLSAAATATVPAGTAVMLQVAAADAQQTIGLTLTAPTAAAIGQDNLLHGSDVATTTAGPDAGDYNFYKLSYNGGGSPKVIGWYWGADNAGSFLSGAHKAWLALPKNGQNAPSRSIGLPGFNEGTTDVVIIPYQPEQPNDAWYDMYGRTLDAAPAASGIYIHNGEKIMIK